MDWKANMNISIVIPAFKNIVDILTCLNSLQATASDFRQIQWVIQDDCSDNLDLRLLIPPYVAFVGRNEINLGFSANVNRGVAHATGDIIVIVNQDIIADGNFSRGWDTVIRTAFEDETIGIVAPRLLFPDGKIQSAAGIFDAHLQPHHRCLGYTDLTHWEVNTPEPVAWATGAFLAIRRTVFDKIGGFDESYVSYFEDVDICLRVKEAGFKVFYEPRISFVHKVGSTWNEVGAQRFANSMRTFHQKWVVPRKIQADVNAVLERWW